MARARNIKPSLFKNELLGEADPLLTILFTGLWCLADRAGRLEDRPKRIKAEIFPYRELPDFNGYLTVLEQLGFIHRYEVDGGAYIQVLNFEKHQSPHKTEKPSEIPEPLEKSDSCPLADKAPLKTETATVKESLIPDSLIPDSVISPNGDTSSADADNPTGRAPDQPKNQTCPQQQIIDLYHQHCPTMPRIKRWTDVRSKALRARWREDEKHRTLEFWERYFQHANQSAFLRGDSKPGWSADLEWLVNSSNFSKVIEGRYHREGQA